MTRKSERHGRVLWRDSVLGHSLPLPRRRSLNLGHPGRSLLYWDGQGRGSRRRGGKSNAKIS